MKYMHDLELPIGQVHTTMLWFPVVSEAIRWIEKRDLGNLVFTPEDDIRDLIRRWVRER